MKLAATMGASSADGVADDLNVAYVSVQTIVDGLNMYDNDWDFGIENALSD